MFFYTVDQDQVDNLPLPANEWRLDLILNEGDTVSGKAATEGFETLEECWAEDKRRAGALRRLPQELTRAFNCDAKAIADTLEAGSQQRTIPSCSASAVYMRGRRLALLGGLLRLMNQNRNLKVAFVSVSDPKWCLDLREDPERLERDVHSTFKRLLNSVRLWDFPGFMFACVSGAYDVGSEKIQLSFHGIYADEKQRATLIWGNDDQILRPSSRRWLEIANAPREICELIPNRVVEGDLGFGFVENPRRMREPYHSLYLMWLSRYSLADRLLLDDVAITPNGLELEISQTDWWLD